MKRKILPVAVVAGLIVIIIATVLISKQIQKYTPTKETQDLTEYFNVKGEDTAAIIFDKELLDTKATLIDGHVYLDYSFIHDKLNSRFFWDANENVLLYATDTQLISAQAESTSYYVAKDTHDNKRVVVKATSESALVDIDFVLAYSSFTYELCDSPSRVLIYTSTSETDTTYTYVKKATQIRVKGGIKSPILSEVEKNDPLILLNTDETWSKVMTNTGIIGYIKNKFITDKAPKDEEASFFTINHVDEKFAHISKDFEICMAWHQVTARASNSEIASVLSSTKGVNVISPTWFYLNDNNGNIVDIGSRDYVKYCHSQGVEVWALISNLENSDVDTEEVLTHTSKRSTLINQILAAAISYELDGINLDFEALDSTRVGEAYIQFVRELSIKLGANGIVLSVDNYVPTDYTAFYNRAEQANFADYVVIMGYDEHYAGSEEAGSVASLSWVEEGVKNTTDKVPSNQVILGMPFYTRVWASTPSEEQIENLEVTEEGEDTVQYTVTSQAYGMRSAANLVASYDAETTWLEDCGQNYATWNEGDTIYEVWLEDSESCEARLKLLDKYSLAGASFWKLGFERNDTWDTIIKYIN